MSTSVIISGTITVRNELRGEEKLNEALARGYADYAATCEAVANVQGHSTRFFAPTASEAREALGAACEEEGHELTFVGGTLHTTNRIAIECTGDPAHSDFPEILLAILKYVGDGKLQVTCYENDESWGLWLHDGEILQLETFTFLATKAQVKRAQISLRLAAEGGAIGEDLYTLLTEWLSA